MWNICTCCYSVLKRYCYLDLGDPLSAQGALNALNNKPIPGTNVSIVLCIVVSPIFVIPLYILSVENLQAQLGRQEGTIRVIP